jgi:hypothetical protein
MPKKKVAFSLRLSYENRQRLIREAKRQDMTPSELSRELLIKGLDELEQGLDPALTRSEGLRILSSFEKLAGSEGGLLGESILPVLKRILASLTLQEFALSDSSNDKKKFKEMIAKSRDEATVFMGDGWRKEPWVS